MSTQKIKNAIAKLKALRAELQIDLAEIPNLQVRADHVLETLVNGLVHTIGEQPTTNGAAFVPTPITNVLGEDVTRPEKVNTESLAPTNADKESLREQALKAFETFLDRDSNVLLESLDSIVIRAVAKKAGMQVSATIPAKITVEFIDEIKKTIIANDAIEVAKVVSQRNEAVEKVVNEFEAKYNELALSNGFELGEYELSEEERSELRDRIGGFIDNEDEITELRNQFTLDATNFFNGVVDARGKSSEQQAAAPEPAKTEPVKEEVVKEDKPTTKPATKTTTRR